MFKGSATSYGLQFFLSSLLKLFKLKNLLPVSTGRRSLLMSAEPSCFGRMLKAVCFIPAVILLNTFSIDQSNAQNVTVAGANTGNGNYATLSTAFNAINGGIQNGTNIIISVTGNTNEPSSGATLFEGAWSSLSIQPAGGIPRMITGTILPGTPLIYFNGADKVSVNGFNLLTFSNPALSANPNTCTFRFSNDAVNNTINRCSILGSSTAPNGGTILFTGGSATGNDNNVISFCDIGPASGFPTMAVVFGGNPSLPSNSNTIQNCNIYDYFNTSALSTGVYVGSGSTDITIRDNKFYQNGARTHTAAAFHSAILINNILGNNYTITGNTIGYSAQSGTGVYAINGVANSTFECISVYAGTTAASTIQGNTITNISMSGSQSGNFDNAPLKCISVYHGLVNIGNVTGNTIGSMSANGSITYSSNSSSAGAVIGISLADSSDLIVSNNSIGGITASNTSSGSANIWGIRSVTSGTLTCQNNVIGGTAANSIQSSSTSTSTIVNGIDNSGGSAVISSNLIKNFTAASGTTASGYSAPVTGIMCNVLNFTQTISQNTIHTITNSDNSNTTVTTGIYLSSTGTGNLVERNFIHSLKAASTSGTITGIYANGGTTDYLNNMIRLGIDASGNSVAGCMIRGINETGGTNDLFFNSVYIGGTSASGSSNTYGFSSSVTGNTRVYRNNIFFNARSNAGGSGKHYSITAGGTSPLPAGLFSNYNILYATGSGSVLGFYNSADQPDLAAWRSATGRDLNSISADPKFADPAGNSTAVNLHIASGTFSPCESAGTLTGSVTNDFDGQTRSALTPTDIGADAGNFTESTAPAISYALLTNSGTGNVSFSNVTITDESGVNITSGTKPRCYYRKTTNSNTFIDNTNTTNGWKYVEAAGSSSPFNFTINISLISGGLFTGDTVQYFVVAQDMTLTPNVGVNSGTFTSMPASVNLTSAAFPLGGAINSYKVDIVNVTGAISGNGAYPTLAAAFTAVNGASQTGANINITISGNTNEPVTGAVLNAGSWTSMTIQPEGGAARTISSAVDPGSALIYLNGADNVKIDGINSGGNSLTISNTTVSSAWGTSTIKFENSTNNNVITRCSVLGSSTGKSGGANIYFGTASNPGPGNNFNLISHCNIGPAGSNLPASGVTSFGSINYFNTGDTIRNCNIYDYFSSADSSAGIFVPWYSSGFVIKDNKFYQTSPRTQISGSPHAAVSVLNSYGSNFTISGNTIGYSSSSGTGRYSFTGVENSMFYGISAENPFFASVDIQNNTIAGISISGSMTMQSVKFINVFNSVSANITGNTIGSVVSPGSITYNSNSHYNMIYGITCNATTSATVNSNTIGSITATNNDPSGGCQIYCMSIVAPSATCNFNNIGGRIPNSIHAVTTSAEPNASVYGISSFPGSVLTGNTITNLTCEGGNSGGVYAQVVGIQSGGHTISQNFIYGLSCTATYARIEGISGSGTISKNLIHSFYSPDSTATFLGIRCGEGSTVQNNMMRLGLDTMGNSMNTGCTIYGLYDDNGSNFYFNSIYIGGTATSGTSSTFCMKSVIQNKTRNYLNNIFCNVRTNNVLSVSHYAVSLAGGGISDDLNCDHNILFTPNTGGKTGLFNGAEQNNLAAWRTSTGQDNNSQAKDPHFFNPALPFFFGLQISGAVTPVEQKGIFIPEVTDDFYGAPRSIMTPTDIGAHAGNFLQSFPLAGDYTVGLALFNSISGKNIYFEKTVRKVFKEVKETGNPSGDNPDKKVMKEVEEETFVPMENGEEYTGSLFISRRENPELPGDAMAGVFASINTALNELYSSGANAPVRFLLLDANITNEAMPLYIGTWPGASSLNTLTIKPQAGVTTTISGNGPAIFDINAADYFILDGSNVTNGITKDLTVTNSSPTGSVVQFINDARRNTIRNCILKGNSSSTNAGVVTLLTTNGPSGNDSNLIQNNDITGNLTFPAYGIYNNGSGGTTDQKNSHNRITGNRIYDISSRGITDEGNSAATLYEGNEIFSVSQMPGRIIGFHIGASTIEGFTFRNNFIHDLKTSGIPGNNLIHGIELADIQNSFTGEIYNNFISLSDLTSNDLRGISDGSTASSSYIICFNSINLSGTVTLGRNSEAYYRVNGSGTVFKNNILVNNRNGSGSNYAIRTSDMLSNFDCDYNDIHAGGGFRSIFGKVGNTEITDLSAWRTLTGKDSSGISADPYFVSNVNLHIDSTQASPVSNKGTHIAGISTDFDNDIRSMTDPDIGADEFNGAYFPVSLNLTAFIEGFYDQTADSQVSDTLTVYLKNSNPPYANVDSARAVVASDGTCNLIFPHASSGSYYIVITHRNSIQTWSAAAVSVSNGGVTNYDLSNASSQAYGNNIRQIDSSPLRFGIYSGDVNHDNTINLNDIISVFNNAGDFVNGYVSTDVNGDNVTTLSDIVLTYNNSAVFIVSVTP